MSKARATPSQSATVDKALKAAWAAAGILSLYAIAIPTSLFGLGSFFWGIVLFLTALAFSFRTTTEKETKYFFGTVVLAMTIFYVVIVRRHAVGLGDPEHDFDLINVIYPGVLLLTGSSSMTLIAARRDYEKTKKPS